MQFVVYDLHPRPSRCTAEKQAECTAPRLMKLVILNSKSLMLQAFFMAPGAVSNALNHIAVWETQSVGQLCIAGRLQRLLMKAHAP